MKLTGLPSVDVPVKANALTSTVESKIRLKVGFNLVVYWLCPLLQLRCSVWMNGNVLFEV